MNFISIMECHQGSERCWCELKVFSWKPTTSTAEGKVFSQFLLRGQKSR